MAIEWSGHQIQNMWLCHFYMSVFCLVNHLCEFGGKEKWGNKLSK